MENPEGALGNEVVVSDIRAAHERNNPVVNARKARCQNFESNFIGGARTEGDCEAAGRPRCSVGRTRDDRAPGLET
jgi:hypothetical protein